MGNGSSQPRSVSPELSLEVSREPQREVTLVEEFVPPDKIEDGQFNSERESQRRELIEILKANSKVIKKQKQDEKRENTLQYQKMYNDITAKYHEQQILLAIRGYLPKKQDRKFYRYLAYLKRKTEINGHNAEYLLHKDGASLSTMSSRASKKRPGDSPVSVVLENESSATCSRAGSRKSNKVVEETTEDMLSKSVDELLGDASIEDTQDENSQTSSVQMKMDTDDVKEKPFIFKKDSFVESSKTLTPKNSAKGKSQKHITTPRQMEKNQKTIKLNLEKRNEAITKKMRQESSFSSFRTHTTSVGDNDTTPMTPVELRRRESKSLTSLNVKSMPTSSRSESDSNASAFKMRNSNLSSRSTRSDGHLNISAVKEHVAPERADSAYSSSSERCDS